MTRRVLGPALLHELMSPALIDLQLLKYLRLRHLLRHVAIRVGLAQLILLPLNTIHLPLDLIDQ